MKLPKPAISRSFSSMFFHVIVLLCCTTLFQPATIKVSALGNETDRTALLKFKESITSDPKRVLSSWNDSIHFCNWLGITCSSRHQRISALNLDGHNLRGTISPYIGNLSFLRFIELGSNSFFGEIPEHVGHLFRLQHLNLSYNMLAGKIPVNLSYCSELSFLSLGSNKLTGNIPSELGSLVKLVQLNLAQNNLTGGIPPSLGNVSTLETLSLAYNNLVGTVPEELGRLKSLSFFGVGANNLSGEIPLSVYNISSMSYFSIAANRFSGALPPNIGLQLPNLQGFGIGGNEFSGTIPESFSNASQLQVFDIGKNNFLGQVPKGFGKLPGLWKLALGKNNLGKYSANSLDFIESLTNISQLEILDLSYNNFGGDLPISVANLSTQLTKLFLGVNQISGHIPSTLDNLVNLILLSMWGNQFTGVIPSSLGKLQNLQVLYLDTNKLSGKIPPSIGNLTRISELYLSRNGLDGSIPASIAGCQNLQDLEISNNNLSGSIPKEVFGLSSLSILIDLSHNFLSGSLPAEVGKLKNINALDISENNLTGEIPETIGDCRSLEFLYLQGNFFEGALPRALALLTGLQYLDLSRNKLSGKIPKDLEKLQLLQHLNLSFNYLEGELPNEGVFGNASAISVVGNTKLCGGVLKLQFPRCPVEESKKGMALGLKLTIAIASAVVVFLLILVFILFFWRRKSQRKPCPAVETISFLSKVEYKRLYQATHGFSPSMLIGIGSFGTVYKGILDNEEKENEVAIKVLNLQKKGASKSFVAECNALRNIRHRNLVKILTCCSSMDYNGNEFKALVFKYMSNGSLEKWLHLVADEENQARKLTSLQRLNIVLDVASALYYLHDQCDQPIIHCDLKPSNVLLDNEMIAHVSDFGLARLISNITGLSEYQSSTIGIKGTIGYAAPEYAMGGEPSTHGDVYSYGILVLEMFTGKTPTDEMFNDGLNLHNFVKTALPERLVQIVDSALLPKEEVEIAAGGSDIDIEEKSFNFEDPNQISTDLQMCLVSVLNIGLACSNDSPKERMNMGDVTRELECIRNAYTVGIHGQRQRTD